MFQAFKNLDQFLFYSQLALPDKILNLPTPHVLLSLTYLKLWAHAETPLVTISILLCPVLKHRMDVSIFVQCVIISIFTLQVWQEVVSGRAYNFLTLCICMCVCVWVLFHVWSVCVTAHTFCLSSVEVHCFSDLPPLFTACTGPAKRTIQSWYWVDFLHEYHRPSLVV